MLLTGNAVLAQKIPGYIYTITGQGIYGVGFSGDGGAAISAEINGPRGIAVDSVGNLYFADSGNARIRRIDHSTGYISTVAGNGTQGSGTGELNYPLDIVLANDTTMYICDSGNYQVVRLNLSTGGLTIVAGSVTPTAWP